MGIKYDRGAASIIKCHDFDDFLKKVRISRFVVTRIFRGQRDIKWKLVSPWDRLFEEAQAGDAMATTRPFRRLESQPWQTPTSKDRIEVRDTFLTLFQDAVIGLHGVNSALLQEPVHAWALGRHHGLVTPLLDWSLSPLVALFFACFDHIEYHNPGFKAGLRSRAGVQVQEENPIAVWELALSRDFLYKNECKVFTSRAEQAHRQKAQRGVFTHLDHPEYRDIESYLVNLSHAPYLTCYEIPGAEVGRALWNLKLMGISYGSLFPDLDGAAIDANTAMAVESLENQYPMPDELQFDVE